MIIIFECSRPALPPGRFKSNLGGKRFRRWWFLWFAVAFWPGDLHDYGEACKDGEWRYS